MSTNYGSDTFWVNDAPLISVPVTDPFLLVGQRITRLLMTPRGGLSVIGGDANRGLDVRRYVLARVSPAKLAQAQDQVRLEVLKDEAVQSAVVKFTYAGGALTIQVDCVLAVGPLQLVLNVTALTVTAVYNYQ